jgi:peptidyl-prolyl cis-trans isomerase SurA
VQVKPADVDAEFARVKAGANKVHYLLAEIFLGVDNPEQDAKIRKDADDIHDQLTKGAPFNQLARQFSQSSTSSAGGDLGAIEEGQLAAELNAAVARMKVGEISEPIRSVGGYYILFLRRRFEPAGTKVQAEDPRPTALTNATPLARVFILLGPKPSKALVEQALNAMQEIRGHIESCPQLAKAVGQMRGIAYQDITRMGMRLGDLAEQIQQQLAKTPPGEGTIPFASAVSVEMFVRCDAPRARAAEVWPMPTKQQVEEQLFQERISTLARGYLARLRRDADVQER